MGGEGLCSHPLPCTDNVLLQAAGLLLYKHLWGPQAPHLLGTGPERSYSRFWEAQLLGGGNPLPWPGLAVPPALTASQPPPGPHDRCANKRGQKSGVQFRPPAAIPLCPPRRAPCKGCFSAGLQVVPSSCRCSFPTVLHPARSLSAFKAPVWDHLLQKPNQDAGLGGCTPSHGADQPVLG